MKKLMEPALPQVLEPGNIQDVLQQHRNEQMLYENQTCDLDISMQEFHSCCFRNVTFTNDMQGCLFVNVIFDHCDFSNVNAQEIVARRVIFRNCRMVGTDFIRATFEDVQILKSLGTYANFSSSKMKRTLFKSCQFVEAGFAMLKWNDIEMKACDLQNTEFLDTSLKNIDLSDCRIDGFMVSPESLRGVKMNRDQALACVTFLGIQIVEE